MSRRSRAAAAPARLPWQRDEGEKRQVLTPEGVPLSLTLADRGDRASAFLLDAVIIGVSLMALALLGQLALGGDLKHASWTGPFVLLALFLMRNFYFLVLEIRWRGRTPGKRVLGIRVVDRHGGSLRAEAVVARNLMREVEVFLPLQVLIAPQLLWPDLPGWARLIASLWAFALALMPLFNRDRLRVGDLVAGTMVVKAPRAVLLPDIGGQEVARAAEPARAQARFSFTSEQLDVYGIYELQVLEDVLRRDAADFAHLEALEAVCEKIKQKIRWDRSRWRVDPDRFLREFYAALRAHLEKKMLFGKRQEDKFSRK